jgi:L-threonylcarbamoyladenylate synthase
VISAEVLCDIEKAASYLRRGGVVAYPTDTVYGLGADVFCEKAVAKVYEMKGRPSDAAMPVLISTATELPRVAVRIPDIAQVLVRQFWPGALTLVLHKKPDIPSIVSGGGNTIGVRVPANGIVLALIRSLGSPITGTSANPTGAQPARSAEEVRALFGDSVDYIFDGGPSEDGQPSTVVDLTIRPAKIVRAGKIPTAVLQPFFESPLELAGATK